MSPLLRLEGLGCAYPAGPGPVLHQIELSLRAGQCLCLTGPSGCGKTTLLKAVMGLLPPDSVSGRIVWPGGGPPALGMVLQNLDAQLLCTTVGDEAAFAPQNLALEPGEVSRRVCAALKAVGLSELKARNVEELSAGQKSRLCLASVLTLEPELLILDEPCGQLDEPGRTRLVEILATLKARGHTILIAEHNLPALNGLVDEYAALDSQGRLVSLDSAAPELDLPAPQPWPQDQGGQLLLSASDLRLEGPGGPVLDGAGLSLRAGEALHVFGANGAGKSSLLACLAGLMRPQGGAVSFGGKPLPKPGGLLGRMSLLFQNPQRQLFEDSVEAEVGFTLKRMGLSPAQISRRTQEALAMCEVEHLASRPPLTLSFGEQHRVALASAMAPRPDLLLCDEPLAGLDLAQRRRVLSALARMGRAHGAALLMASHDHLPQAGWDLQSLTLREGRLV